MKKTCLFLLPLCFVFYNMPMEHRGPIDGRSRSYKEVVRQVPRDVSRDELSDISIADGPELSVRQKLFWATVCGALLVAPYAIPAGIHALRPRGNGVPSRAPAVDALGTVANVTATHADNGTCCAEGFVDHGKGCALEPGVHAEIPVTQKPIDRCVSTVPFDKGKNRWALFKQVQKLIGERPYGESFSKYALSSCYGTAESGVMVLAGFAPHRLYTPWGSIELYGIGSRLTGVITLQSFFSRLNTTFYEALIDDATAGVKYYEVSKDVDGRNKHFHEIARPISRAELMAKRGTDTIIVSDYFRTSPFDRTPTYQVYESLYLVHSIDGEKLPTARRGLLCALTDAAKNEWNCMMRRYEAEQRH